MKMLSYPRTGDLRRAEPEAELRVDKQFAGRAERWASQLDAALRSAT